MVLIKNLRWITLLTDQSPKHSAKNMWGGHFEQGPAPLMEQINASIGFDKRLAHHDIVGSKAHAQMLAAQDIISNDDRDAILSGLDAIGRDIEEGRFSFETALEDIHLNIEARLSERIGEAGKRLHTGRSRNDQVATDFKLWTRDTTDLTMVLIGDLIIALTGKAERHADTIMPGFTHLQAAQPVTFGHHLMAYVEMLSRDHSRFHDARVRMNESPLGAAALAGTSFPIDRAMTAQTLGFDRPARNSIDAVSDRDFVLDYLASASILAVHLSRLAEELVLWSTPQFGFIAMSEDFTSGSSIMPQKRNPDAAELVRGKSGRVIGHLQAMLVTLKGLPLAYSKDMQEDKEGLFDAADTINLCLRAAAQMIEGMTVFPDAMRASAGHGYTTATDLADWLVRTQNAAFRDAHHVAAQAVKLAEREGCELKDLSLTDLQSVDQRITADAFNFLTVDQSARSRTSDGGTAPVRVIEAVEAAKRRWDRGRG